ncbi:MAG: hypothetical protein ACRDGI_09050 [Candidatus Limnocylindrales bacterium]
MTTVHFWLAGAAALVTGALALAEGWSLLAIHRSAGTSNHRFAVDRLILLSALGLALTSLVGAVLLASGHRPNDSLHLLYAPLALIALPVGYGLAHRRPARAPARTGRTAWLLVATLVLLGLELRLFMTG